MQAVQRGQKEGIAEVVSQCDGEQPACRRCRTKQQPCIYRHLLSSHDPFRGYNRPSGPSSSRPSPSSSSEAISGPSAALARLSFPASNRLLARHYFTVISAGVDKVSELENFRHWDSAIRRYYSRYDFVRYGVFALPSLHLAPVDPDARVSHVTAAMEHQNRGISCFRSVLSSSGLSRNDDLEACLASSGLLTICGYASSVAAAGTGTISDPLSGLRQIMSLSRGVGARSSLVSWPSWIGVVRWRRSWWLTMPSVCTRYGDAGG
ncbi:hypothetical protein M432DRAFT_399582 [Thermoascus aurantiacus ATCC 26904]